MFFLGFAASSARAQEPTKAECVAANESAQDLQRADKLIEAREQLRICAAKACPHVVRQDCSDRLATIEKELPTVVLSPKEAAGGLDLSSVTLSVDGTTLSQPLDGSPLPIDPGTHVFTLSLAGHTPATLRIPVGEGEAIRREVVLKPLHPAGRPEGAESPEAAPGPAPVAAPAAAEAPDTKSRPLRIAAWSALGVGGAGLALSAIFGVLGLSKKSALSSACSSDGNCPSSATNSGEAILRNIDGLHFDAAAGNISLGVGIVGAAAGAVLYVLSLDGHPSEPPPPQRAVALRATPWIGLGDVGVAGTFQ
jgi:hypothetical protein